MNLRELCQLPGFHTTILTSFNFDPLFFERIVLRDLLASGCRRILVFADGVQCLPSLEAARTQVFELGRKYQLFPIWRRGTFHPKLLMKLSDAGGIISCGSHNLTRPGWLGLRAPDALSGNREAAVAWRLVPDTVGARQVASVLRALRESTALPAARAALDSLTGTPWLQRLEDTPSDRDLLMSGTSGTLAAQLARRWAARRFDRVRIATGSTDAEGAFIAWAASTFGVREAIIELDPADASFDPRAIERLRARVQIVSRPAPPRPHLKAVRFEGAGSSGLVVGSANCSAAAWLVPAADGGNVEAVVVFDNPSASASEHLFDVTAPTANVADVTFRGASIDQSDPAAGLPRILHAELRRAVGALEFVLSDAVPDASRIQLVLDDQHRAEAHRIDALRWRCVFGPQEYTSRTLFCHAVLDAAHQTNRCWVDDTEQLSSRRGAWLDLRPLEALAGGTRGHEAAQVLKGMAELAHLLLSVQAEDAAPSRTQEDTPTDVPSAGPLTLPEVVASFEQTLRPQPLQSLARGSAEQSLQGVLRAIFLGAQRETLPDAILEEGRVTQSTERPSRESEPEAAEAGRSPSDSQRQRLIRQVSRFVEEISTDEFAESATARQMQQAFAFPLGCSLLAARGEWIGSAADRIDWGRLVRRTCHALLTPRRRKGAQTSETSNAIDRVRFRYEQVGRTSEFDRVVGDGTLWLTLLAAVTRADLGSGSFDRTLLLDEVARAASLRASMSGDQLIDLARLLAIQEDTDTWVSQAIEAVSSMTDLRQRLESSFESLRIASKGRGVAGDWLWRPQIGFARIEQVDDAAHARLYAPSRGAELRNVQLTYYANLKVLGLQG